MPRQNESTVISAFFAILMVLGAAVAAIAIIDAVYNKPTLANVSIATLSIIAALTSIGALVYFLGRKSRRDKFNKKRNEKQEAIARSIVANFNKAKTAAGTPFRYTLNAAARKAMTNMDNDQKLKFMEELGLDKLLTTESAANFAKDVAKATEQENVAQIEDTKAKYEELKANADAANQKMNAQRKAAEEKESKQLLTIEEQRQKGYDRPPPPEQL